MNAAVQMTRMATVAESIRVLNAAEITAPLNAKEWPCKMKLSRTATGMTNPIAIGVAQMIRQATPPNPPCFSGRSDTVRLLVSL